jgi:DNA-directed RNA polymerase subunit RPC12/RpoP
MNQKSAEYSSCGKRSDEEMEQQSVVRCEVCGVVENYVVLYL